MRSISISVAIMEFCLATPIFACFWTPIITGLYAAERLNIVLWFVLNLLLYIGIAVHLLNNICLMKSGRWTTFINRILILLGFIFTTAAFISTYFAYRIMVWTIEVELTDAYTETDGILLILVAIITGMLVGLAILTVGYHWKSEFGQKRKE
jgi:hypothetical protein